MQSDNTETAETNDIEKSAPGIQKVLGALILDVGILCGFWFIGMILATAIWTINEFISNAGRIPNPEPSPVAQIMISIPALYLSILALSVWRGRKLMLQQKPMSLNKKILLAVTVGFLMFLGTTASTHLLSLAGVTLQPSNQLMLEDIGKQIPIFITIFAITIAPVFEELLFRKQIFGRFVRDGYVITGYLASGLLFALMHEPFPTHGVAAWLLILGLYGGMGMVFGWVYRQSRQLWPAILAHASNNLFAISALLVGNSMRRYSGMVGYISHADCFIGNVNENQLAFHRQLMLFIGVDNAVPVSK